MRDSLARWVADSTAIQDIETFHLPTRLDSLAYLDGRNIDLYYSLVGELLNMFRDGSNDSGEWATVGNAFLSLSKSFEGGIKSDTLLFAALSFYSGGYSAAAYLAIRDATPEDWSQEAYRACFDLLARPGVPTSLAVTDLIENVRTGNLEAIQQATAVAKQTALEALQKGPDPWIACRGYAALLEKFGQVNIRSVLPNGQASRWDPLVVSLLDRDPPIWEFFPSQIEAIQAGLLTSPETFSLQMPTGAGKTALTETLMYSHLVESNDSVAVLLVPYRALARELRYSLGQRLNDLHLPARTTYGGTVPTPEETQGLDEVRAIIATPESLTGLLGTNPELYGRITLVMCDEGHLLDTPSRGVSLELLLARFRGRVPRPRMVFLSAIVPNIEEINAWLGGSDSTVVRSDFRPAIAEYAVLRPVGSGAASSIDLDVQSLDATRSAYLLDQFLTAADFEYTSPETHRRRSYPHSSVKTRSVAAARRALPLGTVAVFATAKTGNQGVISLADELLLQLDRGISLPKPIDFVNQEGFDRVDLVVGYLGHEFGNDWSGTRALRQGVVLHHGDIPQETREVLEELVTDQIIPMVICTSTLAEGVNLPIRTLVLYSVERRDREGQSTPMFARDIKNLVGRAGRARSSTRGLIICANENQWNNIRLVAAGTPGEPVRGSLLRLTENLHRLLAQQNALSLPEFGIANEDLEAVPALFSLVDGVDATLIELITADMGSKEFLALAEQLVSNTFAAQGNGETEERILRTVFNLRAGRIFQMQQTGRLNWVRQTGARPRLVASVVTDLFPLTEHWKDVTSVLDNALLDSVLGWALSHPEIQHAAREAYRKDSGAEPLGVGELRKMVDPWLQGRPFRVIAESAGLNIDDCLRIHSQVVAFSLVTVVEQGVSLLHSVASDNSVSLADSVGLLPDCLRYGVSVRAARDLLVGGLRHRDAAVQLGNLIETPGLSLLQPAFLDPFRRAQELMQDTDVWMENLGAFQFQRTKEDISRHFNTRGRTNR